MAETAVDVVRSLGIRMSYEEAAENPLLEVAWKGPVQHYRCTLRYGRRKFETHCSMADEDLHRLPTAPLVFGLLLREASLFECFRDLDEFTRVYTAAACTDERVVARTYQKLGQLSRRLKRFLTPGVYFELAEWAASAYERSER